MAYNAVSQADHELASDSESRGPSPQPRLGSISMIRSRTTATYDLVEEDDYEAIADPCPPTRPRLNTSPKVSPRRPLPSAAPAHPAPDVSPTEDRADLQTSIPLSHPTPGLQSLQGAYLHNVERLEKTAERLSLSSTDIGSEIRKMDLEQRRRSSSTSNYTNSHSAQDGQPHTVGSRRGSLQSVSRLAQLSEQQALEDLPEHSTTTQHPIHSYFPPPPEPAAHHPEMNDQVGIERPSSAASGDTYRQAKILFTDFDGVHFVPNGDRRLSLTRPPLAIRSEPYKQPQEGENMVFYPAPVPMMLNLPPRLSQRPDQTEREKRRTQLLDVVLPENRKSAPWLSDQDQINDRRRTKQPSDLPSQLRASVFFEPPSASLDIDPAQTSAVATLDSILDASTTAPVTAFTDHPFAGPLGSEVYGSSKHGKDVSGQRKKQRPKSTLPMGQQPSNTNLRSSTLAVNTIHPTSDARAADTYETTSLRRHDRESGTDTENDSESGTESSSGEDDSEEEEEEEEYDESHYIGPPATLLAELEKRKYDLKHRRRTAANAVGMHSTLLELEAVAAKQSEHRRQKPVALAWETPDAHNNDEDEDEDVPLGMLFPDKAQAADESRPLGLMEKREMEESEPLSRRRARLRGEPLPQPLEQRPMTMYSQAHQGSLDSPPENESGDEGETLGQRLRRLKGHERNVSKADTDFTTELLAEFDNLKDDENKDTENEPSQEDESLAQRRARLKKEADAKRNSGLKIPRYRRSMADVLHARRPTTAGHQSLQQEVPNPNGPAGQLNHRMSMQQLPVSAVPPKTAGGYSQYQAPSMVVPFGHGMAHPNTFYSDAILGNGHLSYAMPNNFHPNAVRQGEPGQREFIDRWRQSIV
ncbi:hypothetical protein BJY00DRAFT_262219 [Aspergillus carlsbadensis]|nr:hypothetical protein BJY00DRAFT_262219 [Aspergillus carlsbadensis]